MCLPSTHEESRYDSLLETRGSGRTWLIAILSLIKLEILDRMAVEDRTASRSEAAEWLEAGGIQGCREKKKRLPCSISSSTPMYAVESVDVAEVVSGIMGYYRLLGLSTLAF